MYSYIKGTLEYIDIDYVVIDVNGIGYKIYTSVHSMKSSILKEQIKMYTHLHVREDNISLFGFLTVDELEMFELLISVSGIGPKVAVSLMSHIDPSKFALSLVNNDTKELTKAPGIGAKTAKRIILELKDKINTEQLQEEVQTEEIKTDDKTDEAINALVVLGYSKSEASNAVKSVEKSGDVETIIKGALNKLVKY